MTALHIRPNYLHLVKSRPANLNPAATISATNAQVTAYSFGLHSAHFGADLAQRTAAARAYIRSRSTLTAKLRRIFL
jgi:hypothetical protein